jgi:hypothetical protein
MLQHLLARIAGFADALVFRLRSVHAPSQVDEGRLLLKAVFEALFDSPGFQEQLL